MKALSRAAHLRARFIPVLAVLATTGIMAGCGGDAHHAEAPAGAPVAVRAVAVQPGPVAGVMQATGSLHGQREAVLAAKVMGTVIEFRKKAGDPIRRGEVLVVLDDRESAGNIGQAEGALAQAKAAASLAESNLKRFEILFERGSASQLELDQARFAHESARGAVRQAEGAVSAAGSYGAQIVAPFDGRVVDRMAEEGDLAAPGRPLMKVEDARTLRLHVTLSEREIGAAVPGAEVEVVVPSVPGRTWTGTVAEVVPAVDPATRSTTVKIDLPGDPALRSGLFARARFRTGERESLGVPRAALVRRGGMVGVFVVDGSRASFRLVEAAEAAGDVVEVLSGLVPGDRVVLDPPSTLTEGAAVEVQP